MALVLDGNGSMTLGNGDLTGMAMGALEANAIGAGSVRQIVQATTINQASTTSTSFVASNLGGSITPTSSASKILVCVTTSYQTSQANYGIFFGLFRGSVNGTNIAGYEWGDWYAANSRIIGPATMTYLDSPNTTSPINYVLGFKSESSSFSVSTPGAGNWISTMILMEIAG